MSHLTPDRDAVTSRRYAASPWTRRRSERRARLLVDQSLFNAHPRVFGYITASPPPIGILGDFLASALNASVGAWALSPAATEIVTRVGRQVAQRSRPGTRQSFAVAPQSVRTSSVWRSRTSAA